MGIRCCISKAETVIRRQLQEPDRNHGHGDLGRELLTSLLSFNPAGVNVQLNASDCLT